MKCCLFIISIIVAFSSISQNQLELVDINDKPVVVTNGFVIIVNESSCGLCFEKIIRIKKGIQKFSYVPNYVLFTSLNLPIEYRASLINDSEKYNLGADISYLFMDQIQKLDFQQKIEIPKTSGSPYIICLSSSQSSILVLNYQMLFDSTIKTKTFIQKIKTYFKIKP